MAANITEIMSRLSEQYQIPIDTNEDIKSGLRVFSQRDTNFDDSLDEQEVKEFHLPKYMAEKLFVSESGEKCKTITVKQFIKRMFFRNISQYWQVVFDKIDTDGDKFLDQTEVETFLTAVGIAKLGDTEAALKVLNGYDANKDGKLSFKEFVTYLNANLDESIDAIVEAEKSAKKQS
ncbi:uncharacterized protein LOC141914148 [Tubulanus polymorphus]|uniref:uncharacterized protein LOC141914148 n=1 Tax=Tubulanus polymorphus TaxID=672921 RepID=UPI003DA264D4